ncbi:DUF4468 domain-containing protein [Lutimonas vermicola]|uniref:DUF4468 domain-containing protein n=1 Tax=Lutimonas vermicola TaxID=414288 RepID=A0ABU9L256_9FLAO
MKKRKIITPLILFLSFYFGQAQLIMIDGETGEYRYEDVVRAEGISSTEIKSRAKSWLTNYYTQIDSMYTDSMGVKQLNTYHFEWKLISKTIKVNLFFDVSIKAKDNRYKYDFSNFRVGKRVKGDLQAIDLKTYIERFPTDYQILVEEPVDTEMTKAINSLNYFIVNNKMEVQEDDW